MRISDWSSDVCSSDLSVNAIYLFSDGDEDYLPDAALVADLYDNGSGMPSISNPTIDAFGFVVPGVDAFPRIRWGRARPAASASAPGSRSFTQPKTSRRFSPPQSTRRASGTERAWQ